MRTVETFVAVGKSQDTLLRRATGNPCQKGHGILPGVVWEGAELSVLRMLGLFDRPADENALEALLKVTCDPWPYGVA